MTLEDDKRRLPKPVPPEQMTPRLVDDMFMLDSAIQDYLFASPRLWPQHEETIRHGLLHNAAVQMHALKMIQLMQRCFPDGIRFRDDLPQEIRTLLLDRCHTCGVKPPEPSL